MHTGRRVLVGLSVVALSLAAISLSSGRNTTVYPRLALPRVINDADDCAIWIHPTDPAKSIIIGNDKKGTRRGLYVYDLGGRVLQFLRMRAPSNLDVRYGLALGGRQVDICVVVEQLWDVLKVFAIDPETRQLRDVTAPGGVRTHIGRKSYGLALYQHPPDGAIFAFVSKRAPSSDIVQIRLADDGQGRVTGSLVRRLDGSTIRTHVEGMVADDELGFLYACDEQDAVLKFAAAPERPSRPIGTFAHGDGIHGDREGIAVYKCPDGTGYLLLSSQGDSTVKVYAREGDNRFIKTVDTVGAEDTDGLDVTPCSAGPRFPKGFLVCHNNAKTNFVVYAWEDIAAGELKVRTDYDPRRTGPAGGLPPAIPDGD